MITLKIREKFLYILLVVVGLIGLVCSVLTLVLWLDKINLTNIGDIVNQMLFDIGLAVAFSGIMIFGFTRINDAKGGENGLFFKTSCAFALMIVGLIMNTPTGPEFYQAMVFMVAVNLIPLAYCLRYKDYLDGGASSIVISVIALIGIALEVVCIFNLTTAKTGITVLDNYNLGRIFLSIASILTFMLFLIDAFCKLFKINKKHGGLIIFIVATGAFALSVVSLILMLPHTQSIIGLTKETYYTIINLVFSALFSMAFGFFKLFYKIENTTVQTDSMPNYDTPVKNTTEIFTNCKEVIVSEVPN
ncbi:MAG: hypothetical protein FWD32_02060 [Firmicutes bacterium]|nr:hypothetical protein [Bacillota bacterium]